jgi:prefoldin subunit 5
MNVTELQNELKEGQRGFIATQEKFLAEFAACQTELEQKKAEVDGLKLQVESLQNSLAQTKAESLRVRNDAAAFTDAIAQSDRLFSEAFRGVQHLVGAIKSFQEETVHLQAKMAEIEKVNTESRRLLGRLTS